MPKLTQQEWEEACRKKHNGKYDYSKSVYVNNKTKVIIICPDHGEFFQEASSHKRGTSCKDCAIDSRKLPLAEWIERCRIKHHNKYDYSKVCKYVNGRSLVTIICPEHDEFKQRAEHHLRGSGCSKCSGRYNYTTEEWIKEAIKKHGDKYTYSKANYKNAHTSITITCSRHGDFEQFPYSHLNAGNGCSKCSKKYNPTTDEWIKKAVKVHGTKYDYSKTTYIKSTIKVIIICPEHGVFPQYPRDHINGFGCSKCSDKYNYTTEEWILKAQDKHGDLYDYSKVNYINTKTNVTIICSKHGEYPQNPQRHLSGAGCPTCQNKSEGKLLAYLQSLFSNIIYQAKFDWCINPETNNYLPFDFCIEELKIIICLDGFQHFEQISNWTPPDETRKRDVYKMIRALENGYTIIRVLQEDVYNNRNGWQNKLQDAIKEYKKPDVVIISDINIYEKHLIDLNVVKSVYFK